ncbi:MAG: 23S rRNA (pseudouridine(1915)-N(3))-methyltransferase RlmH [Xanthomonadales bacterium]|nr:23S rRNA (pseudouridine(1915)-N(3))-methyltransferase RlmH [Xanthomonadales bacterium]
MKIRLLAVGQKMPKWVTAGVTEYTRRLPAHLGLDVVELAPGRRSRNQPPDHAIAAERDALMKSLKPDDTVVALDRAGELWSTEKLASRLRGWMGSGRNVALLVGGPDGLHADCLTRANMSWSLGRITLPHPLVRIILAEQIYRAWTILEGHPYHRG